MVKQLIETVEVGAGGAASIEFTSIPQDGVDLLCVLSGRTGRTAGVSDPVQIQPNGASTNLSSIRLYGDGSAVTSNSYTAVYSHANENLSTASTFGNSSIYISNYAGSTAKSISVDAVTEDNATSADQSIYAGLWDSTAAITSLKLVPIVGFLEHSTASLYKIIAGNDGTTTVS